MAEIKSLKAQIKESKANFTWWERTKHFISLWDGIIAIPLGLLLFMGYGWIGYWVFGESFVPYDPAFFHAAVYTVTIMVVANTAAFLGVNFNFREVWRYYYCESAKDFRELKPLYKILIFLGIYYSFISMFIILFKALL